MNQKQISSHLKKLETEFLTENVRKNSDRLNQLLDDNFNEVGSSGIVWTKQTMIEALKKELFIETQIKNFKLTLPAKNVALVTYLARRKKTLNKPVSESYHSSIWLLCDNKWKMIFHQGTPIV